MTPRDSPDTEGDTVPGGEAPAWRRVVRRIGRQVGQLERTLSGHVGDAGTRGRIRRATTVLAAVVGGLSLLLAAVVVLVPVGEFAVPTGRGPLFLAGVAVAALAARDLYGNGGDANPEVSFPASPSARETSDPSASVAGADLDDRIDQVTSNEGGGIGRAVSEKQVRDRVYGTVIAVIRDTESCSRSTAVHQIDRGVWTDRPRARAFLSDDDAGLPVSVRIRDWISGEAFERQVRATVEELAAREGVDTGELAPEPVGLDELPDFDPAAPAPDPAPDDWRESDAASSDENEDEEADETDVGPELFRRELVGANPEPQSDGDPLDPSDGDDRQESLDGDGRVADGDPASAATEENDPASATTEGGDQA